MTTSDAIRGLRAAIVAGLAVVPYVYRAEFVRAVDGDTIEVDVDLGFHVGLRVTLRLSGIDCPERKGETKQAGDEAMQWCAGWAGTARKLVVQTEKDRGEKYGRYLARVFSEWSGACLNDALVAAGHAVPYDGGKRA